MSSRFFIKNILIHCETIIDVNFHISSSLKKFATFFKSFHSKFNLIQLIFGVVINRLSFQH
jgi:hypothetical protein